MTHSNSTRIILFDIGGVLVRWDPVNLYSGMFADPNEMQAFLSTCCTREWHVRHDRGTPMDENAAPLIAKYPHWADAIRAWKTRWADMFDGAMPGMPELLAELRAAGHALYALTNMPAEIMPENFRLFPFLHDFRDIFVSAETGLMKPDPASFQHALDHMQARAKDVIFIDDVAENVDAAKSMGMPAIQFTNAADLRHTLRAKGVIF